PTPPPSPLSLHDALPISTCCARRKRRGGHYSRPAFSLSWLMPLRPGRELVPEKRMMILTADQLEMATHGGDVLMILALSSAGVRSEEHTSELQSPYDLVC